ncbi:hypothetical protein OESDEN_13886 [Oesophagostomum dentatum]|uniref:Uncharacterized protein n=1 Tax=Oesophagostomum dentatum TaxID=61180 RepID=A0A0B1SM14_OESDE|nr:hypothetical protein OESDEN_13886 [Oesophagostomum dentatum]
MWVTRGKSQKGPYSFTVNLAVEEPRCGQNKVIGSEQKASADLFLILTTLKD